jgi:hypothetical protein
MARTNAKKYFGSSGSSSTSEIFPPKRKITKKRKRKIGPRKPSFIAKHGHIKICKLVHHRSKAGRTYLAKLHREQGRKGYVKVPGFARSYIINKHHRREARAGGLKVHRNIIARYRRKHKKGQRF